MTDRKRDPLLEGYQFGDAQGLADLEAYMRAAGETAARMVDAIYADFDTNRDTGDETTT